MLLTFDFTSDVPLYMQIRNQIVIGIADGKLHSGDKLPTVRALAEESGINTMTVSKAYNLLKQEGYITTDRRKGAIVCAQEKTTEVKEETINALRLHISELRATGLSGDEIHSLLDKICQEAGI